jgi:putative hydrolase of the HAD superfamily
MKTSDLCVVFDLDDTLYLECEYVASGFEAVGDWCLCNLKMSGVQELAQSLFQQGQRGNIFDSVVEQIGAQQPSQTVTEMIRVYREHNPRIAMPVDAIECLDRLQQRVHLCLLTDGDSRSQWAKIDALGLRTVFDAIVVTGDWGAEFWKPHPKGFRHLQMQVASSKFIYIADNPAKDFVAPQQLGWGTVRVNRPRSLHHNRASGSQPAVFEVRDLDPIPELLQQLYPSSFLD